jgi:hypothetical protein
MKRACFASHKQRRPQSLARQGLQSSDEVTRKHAAMSRKSLDQDRFTLDSRDVASSFTHTASSQVLYAGSNVESKSHENENFHEQTLLSLMKRWYKPI